MQKICWLKENRADHDQRAIKAITTLTNTSLISTCKYQIDLGLLLMTLLMYETLPFLSIALKNTAIICSVLLKKFCLPVHVWQKLQVPYCKNTSYFFSKNLILCVLEHNEYYTNSLVRLMVHCTTGPRSVPAMIQVMPVHFFKCYCTQEVQNGTQFWLYTILAFLSAKELIIFHMLHASDLLRSITIFSSNRLVSWLVRIRSTVFIWL